MNRRAPSELLDGTGAEGRGTLHKGGCQGEMDGVGLPHGQDDRHAHHTEDQDLLLRREDNINIKYIIKSGGDEKGSDGIYCEYKFYKIEKDLVGNLVIMLLCSNIAILIYYMIFIKQIKLYELFFLSKLKICYFFFIEV